MGDMLELAELLGMGGQEEQQQVSSKTMLLMWCALKARSQRDAAQGSSKSSSR
jgi:hypothetical protein